MWLVVARLAVALLPFSVIARRLGRAVPPGFGADEAACPADAGLVADVGWAVAAAARHLPLEMVCLPRALAARIMLARRGVASVLSFGIPADRNRGGPSHAWLSVGAQEVTGYPLPAGIVEIVRYS